jgi:hypothetical protein
MAALAPPKPTNLHSELDQYLSTNVVYVADPIAWWHEHCTLYPQLSQMALNFLTIPGMCFIVHFLMFHHQYIIIATSIDVEQLFSHGCLILSHVHSHMSSPTTCALIYLRIWSQLNLIKAQDVETVSKFPDLTGDEDILEDGWDAIDEE